jgi:hypothetical protein
MSRAPQRTCSACRAVKDKKAMIRVALDKQNAMSVDIYGKQPGRGAYICGECIEKGNLEKTKCLERSFKRQIPKEIYECLKPLTEKPPRY